MLVLFENPTPVCMLVIEVFQSSSHMRFQKSWVGLFLHRDFWILIAIAIDRAHSALLLKDHTLYWSGGGAGSLPHVELFLSFAIDCWSVTCLKSHRNPHYIHRLVKLCILLPRAKICLVTVFRARIKCIAIAWWKCVIHLHTVSTRFIKIRTFSFRFDKSSRELYHGV